MSFRRGWVPPTHWARKPRPYDESMGYKKMGLAEETVGYPHTQSNYPAKHSTKHYPITHSNKHYPTKHSNKHYPTDDSVGHDLKQKINIRSQHHETHNYTG